MKIFSEKRELRGLSGNTAGSNDGCTEFLVTEYLMSALLVLLFVVML